MMDQVACQLAFSLAGWLGGVGERTTDRSADCLLSFTVLFLTEHPLLLAFGALTFSINNSRIAEPTSASVSQSANQPASESDGQETRDRLPDSTQAALGSPSPTFNIVQFAPHKINVPPTVTSLLVSTRNSESTHSCING